MNMFEINHSLLRQFGPENWTLYKGKHLLSFVDNHDVTRVASILTNERHLPLIYALAFGMPGIPCVYYGSEYGIKAVKGKNTDLPLRPELDIDSLKDADKKLFKLICSLGEIRSKSEAIKHGTYNPIIIKNEQFIFLRKFKDEEIYVALNLDDKAVEVNCNINVHNGIDLLTEKAVTINGKISIQPYGALIISKDNSI